MVRDIYYHFLETKEKEEENTRHGLQQGRARWELVEKNNRPPQLLHLFPWEIKKIITANDLACQFGLKVNGKQVREHLLMYWDSEIATRVVSGERIPIQLLDVDSKTEYRVILAKWPNRDMFLIQGTWFRDFMASRNLAAGMTIGMYWDKKSETLRVSVLDKFN